MIIKYCTRIFYKCYNIYQNLYFSQNKLFYYYFKIMIYFYSKGDMKNFLNISDLHQLKLTYYLPMIKILRKQNLMFEFVMKSAKFLKYLNLCFNPDSILQIYLNTDCKVKKIINVIHN